VWFWFGGVGVQFECDGCCLVLRASWEDMVVHSVGDDVVWCWCQGVGLGVVRQDWGGRGCDWLASTRWCTFGIPIHLAAWEGTWGKRVLDKFWKRLLTSL
jgi:hypothetical protein